ncbi:unnamed protein product [Spirodela intermedia]|uniref:Protein kinase domain-containing protein n=1 Tax=Spirodela intermedia TaxID=51605 RepID=A0A7I8J2P4_SPIIN|nr:unnamed protein product [Spirodela intermedia]CAA6664485.1 unnamed protein product [Spirodela intermedia]
MRFGLCSSSGRASGRILRSGARLVESCVGNGGRSCPSTFYGIACDGNGAVVALTLDGLGISGDLKLSTLAGMKSLRSISLSGNKFTGRLVPAIGYLTSLQHLDLSGNQFYGPVPRRITDLQDLVHLNLSFNGFKGGLPDGFQNLHQLRVLDLHSNGLWADASAVMSELRNVEHLDLSDNAFYGRLPMNSSNLLSLADTAKFINLSYNELSGGFFTGDSLALFRNLEILDVSDNRLSGELLSFGLPPNLRVLRARKNQLHGSLPEELLESSLALVELDLSGNGFTGSIFSINSTSLKILNLSSNSFSGPLPSSIGSCSTVDLSQNIISGDLSYISQWGAMLEHIDLSSNRLSGSLPVFSQFQVLTSIKIRNNSLVGNLPSMLGSYPKVSVIDLSVNKLTGPLLPNLFTSLTLTFLNLSDNHFSGTIPLQTHNSTESPILPFTSLMQFLIFEMQKLKLLDLQKNSLTGEIPQEIGELDSLEVLDLSMNHFKGNIPNMLQVSLKTFNVSYNDLSGLIPEKLKRFREDSFFPGNSFLLFPDGLSTENGGSGLINNEAEGHLRSRIRVITIVLAVGAVALILVISMAIYKIRTQSSSREETIQTECLWRRCNTGKIYPSNLCGSDLRKVSVEAPNHSAQRSCDVPGGLVPSHASTSSPRSIDTYLADRCGVLDIDSPDQLAGELFFLDDSLVFSVEDLSQSPSESLGRSSYGISYKATLDCGHTLTVKLLRAHLVRHRKEFAKEVKRIGSIQHPNIIPIRAYYWGPREQERLILSDYVHGDSLAHHLHESSPRRRHPHLSFHQRLRIAADIARALRHLHCVGGLPHGNLKSSNIFLTGPDLTARLTGQCLHRLMLPEGAAEQMLTLAALGYAAGPGSAPSFEADVYAFGVVVMELLTGRSAGDIITGWCGVFDLPEWVQMFAREGRELDCLDVSPGDYEEARGAMEELLAVALRCVSPGERESGPMEGPSLQRSAP